MGRNQHGTSRTPSPTGWCEYRGRCGSAGGASPSPTETDVPGCEVGRHLIRPSVRTGAPSPQGEGKRDVEDAVPYGMMQISGAGANLREGQAPPLRGECEAVRCRRRGGRPRPPVDMNEGWRNGPPGRRPLRMRSRQAVRRPREGQAPPLRGRTNAGAGTGDTSSAPVYALGHLPLKGKASGTSRTPSPTGSAKMGSPDGKSHFLILSLILLSCRAFLILSRRRPARAATGQILQCPRRCARRWG